MEFMLMYRLKGDPYENVQSYTGKMTDILTTWGDKAWQFDEFQLTAMESGITIAASRGDAVVIYEEMPLSFGTLIKNFRSRKGREEQVMAVRSKKTEKSAEQAQAQAQALTIEVLRAKDFTKDDAKENECSIVFDMKVNGVTIYGCWYRTGSDKKGEDYEMVSFPSQKGKDGKYYNHAYVQLQQSDIDFISSEIEKLL